MGRVDQVGHPGTLLGVLPDPELADHTADLAPGDALILYTDGLTDAYAPGRIVKRAGLVAALESCAGRSATEIASGLQEAVLGAQRRPSRATTSSSSCSGFRNAPRQRIRDSAGVGTVMPLARSEARIDRRAAGRAPLRRDRSIERRRARRSCGAAIGEQGGGLVVDLSELAFLDSTGIRMLFELAAELKRRQQALRVVVPGRRRTSGSILDTVGLKQAAATDHTVGEAVAALNPSG